MLNRSFLLSILSLALITTHSQPFWGAKAPLPFETPADSLKHGQFTWEPAIAPAGPILVVVSLDEQLAYTYRNGLLIGVATVSTGKQGHLTPTGVFTTLQKDADHHSSKYNNASMPYTQRLTNFGIALHAGGLPGYPSSHGCIHLPSEYARLLFQASPLGMTVAITTAKTAPTEVNHPAFLTPINVKGRKSVAPRLDQTETFRWNPELSTEGPLSVIISRYDQRLVVMRNGVEIGRTKIIIKDPTDSIGTYVLVARSADTTNLKNTLQDRNRIRKWISLNFANLPYGKHKIEDPLNDQRITIPRNFLAYVLPMVKAGTSVVITDAPILENTTGVGLTLLTSSAMNNDPTL